MGDVYSAVMAGAEVIALIDGIFEGGPSVWHKEILFALSRGVRVVAGGSLGALRAAETHRFGTEGVGETFAWFRDEVLEDDDEVAVAFGSAAEGFRPSSDAMVSLRWGSVRPEIGRSLRPRRTVSWSPRARLATIPTVIGARCSTISDG